jgi:membrane protease YdiL (CAAX protease family)
MALLAAALYWQGGLGAIWQGAFGLLRDQQSMVLFLALVGLDLAFILVVHVRLVRTGATSGRGLGFVGDRFWRNVGLGVLGWTLILVASAVIGLAFLPSGARQQQAELRVIGEATPAVFYLFFAAGSLLAPFTEELFFRGYVFRAYALRKGLGQAYVLSATVFALPHLNPTAGLATNVALFVPLAVIGCILAFLIHRSGSLVAPVVAHGLNNALALLAVYFLARFSP